MGLNINLNSPKDAKDPVIDVDIVSASCRDPNVEKVDHELVSDGRTLSTKFWSDLAIESCLRYGHSLLNCE